MSNDNTVWPLISHLEFISELESLGWIHCSCIWVPCGLICGSHRRYEGGRWLQSCWYLQVFAPLSYPFHSSLEKLGFFSSFVTKISVVSQVSQILQISPGASKITAALLRDNKPGYLPAGFFAGCPAVNLTRKVLWMDVCHNTVFVFPYLAVSIFD